MIALLDVLEHVPDDKGSLTAIRRRLKPGGALLVTVPANPWMWSAHDVAHHHHRRYRKARDRRAGEATPAMRSTCCRRSTRCCSRSIAGVRLDQQVRGHDSADDALPAKPINSALDKLFGAEAGLIGRLPFPFGVSLVAVLRRPAAERRPA